MSNYKYFQLYQDCIVTMGACKTLILDHYKSCFISLYNDDIPLEFYTHYSLINNESNYKLIKIFHDNRFGFFTNEINTLKKMIVWDSPKLINELIIEHSDDFEDYDLSKLYKQFDSMGIEFLQIRFLNFSIDKFNIIFQLLKSSCIRTIELLMPYSEKFASADKVINFLSNNYHRIQIVYLYNAPLNKSIQYGDNFNIVYCKNNLIDVSQCGIVSEDYFISDLKNISKSMLFNNCLKEKLFISLDGKIKNCPSSSFSYGNVKNNDLMSISKHPAFNINRNITKDEINICKDCEFRYICNDCRVYTENNHFSDDGIDISKPKKCNYDPYNGEWKF